MKKKKVKSFNLSIAAVDVFDRIIARYRKDIEATGLVGTKISESSILERVILDKGSELGIKPVKKLLTLVLLLLPLSASAVDPVRLRTDGGWHGNRDMQQVNLYNPRTNTDLSGTINRQSRSGVLYDYRSNKYVDVNVTPSGEVEIYE